ncbi:MAG: diacylglycerol kinase family protein [Caldimonas sp.]
MTFASSGPAAAPERGGAAPAATPPCLLVNPRSFRAARGLADRAIALAAAQGAEVVRVERGEDVSAALDSILARRQRHVAVLAGDGTVREVVERLAGLPSGHWLPDLLILPGGRTNLTAADLVPRADPLGTLTKALAWAGDGRWDAAVVERVPLCIAQAPAPRRFGFFFGGAAVDSVVRLAQDYRYGGSGPLRSGPLSSPWVIAKVGARALVGRAGISLPTLEIEAEGCGRLGGEIRLLLVTTLLHRSGLFSPYATRGQGELRLTAVSRAARWFWPALPRLLTGRYSKAMNPDHGYLSGNCGRVQIAGLAGYVLDGERFDTDPTRPVVITPGPGLRFLSR